LILAGLTVSLVSGAWLGPTRFFSGAAEADQSHVSAADRKTVQCLGRLEPGQAVLNISPGDGIRIDRLLVTEGQTVRVGDLLATTDSHNDLLGEKNYTESQLREARDQVDAETARGRTLIMEAEAALRQVDEVNCHDIAAQKAQILLFGVQLEEARRDFNRARTLQTAHSASREEYDRHELAVRRLTRQVEVGKAKLAQLMADQKISRLEKQAQLETARADLLKAVRAIPVDSLQKRITWIRARLDRTRICAPVTGQVLRVFTYPGERVGSKPLLQLGETGKMYAVAEVYETDVRFVRQGQRATASSPALGQPLTGTVERIGLRIYKNDVLNVDPCADTDSRVVEVRIRLDDPAPAARMIFLQVDVSIDLADRASDFSRP